MQTSKIKFILKNLITGLIIIFFTNLIKAQQEELVIPQISIEKLTPTVSNSNMLNPPEVEQRVEQNALSTIPPEKIGPKVNFNQSQTNNIDFSSFQNKNENSCPKLSSPLCHLTKNRENKSAMKSFVKERGLTVKNGKVRATIYPNYGETTACIHMKSLLKLGVILDAVASLSIRAYIPIGKLEEAADVAGVRQISQPNQPKVNTITSEGVVWMNSDNWQNNTYKGNGVKIAIIDLGFNNLTTAQGSGEIPTTYTSQDFTGTGLETGTNHGTGVAEIIFDVAPDAEYYFYKIGDLTDLELAKDDAIANGVCIINFSVGFFNAGGYYDGTGSACDIVQDAIDNGILWVNSAGNHANKHLRDQFLDIGDGTHDFGGINVNPLIVPGTSSYYIPAIGEPIQLTMNWDEYPGSSQDYDLLLLASNPTPVNWGVVVSSTNLQTGSQAPEESINYINQFPLAIYSVAIVKKAATAPIDFTLFSTGGQALAFGTRSNSIADPATVTDVITVGAIDKDFYLLGPQASYSSQGPTNDGRMKPDIAGPTNVSTSIVSNGSNLFGGTSAAAPHVAGAIAQIKSRFPAFTTQQIKAYLYHNSTFDLGLSGVDSLYGYGALVLSDAYKSNSNDTTIVNNCNDTDVQEPVISPCTVSNCNGPNCIVVTNGNNSGAGSLRQAIADIPSGGTITFAASVNTVNLTSEIDVNKSLTIDGCPGVTIDGGNSTRLLFFKTGNYTANLNHLTLQNGYVHSINNALSSGAAFWAHAGTTVNLTDVIIRDNGGGARSGALAIFKSTFNCERCFFFDNWSTGQGGALVNQDSDASFKTSVFRGNIAHGDSLTLPDGTKTAQGASGGAIITFSYYSNSTSLTLEDCIFEDNASNRGIGGGISISNRAIGWTTNVTIDNTIFNGNASYNGGGIAIVSPGTNLVVNNSRIVNNIGIFGGGVLVGLANATATFNSCDIRGNSALYQGGGVLVVQDNATANFNQTTISNNKAGYYGGGIANFGGIVNATNTLVDHNASSNIGWAGGILSISLRRDTTTTADDDDACLNLYNSTIADNTGLHNNGLLVVKEGTAASKLNIQNSILCNPAGNSDFRDYSNCYTDPTITSCGGNIACDTTAIGIFTHPTDQNNVDPLFVDPDNGNYNLQACSPAIDAGQDSCMATPTSDLACNPRDAIADAGAYEFGGGTSGAVIAYAGPNQFICPGDSVMIGDSSMVSCGIPVSLEWIPTTGLDDPTSPTPIASPSQTTFYQLIVTDINGNTTIDDVEVQVGPHAGIIAGNSIIAQNATGEVYSVVNSPGSSYTWSISPGAVTGGATIVSGQTTNQVTVDWGSVEGYIMVFETTSAGCSGNPSGMTIQFPNSSVPFQVNTSNISGTFRGQATINNATPPNGSWIAAFDPNGNVAGAAMLIMSGGIAYISFPIYGDDPSSTGVDEGMGAGDTYFTLKLYDAVEQTILDYPNSQTIFQFTAWQANNGAPIPTYASPTDIYNFEGCEQDVIPLNAGWNLISFDVIARDSTVQNMFSSLIPSNLQYVTSFDNGSVLYDPLLFPTILNTLQNVTRGFGYWVRVQVADTLVVCGTPISPGYKKDLDINWNLVGYPPAGCQPVETYFNSLITTNNLIYVTGFDQMSVLFDPNNLPIFNTLTDVCNGFGYWVKTNAAVSSGSWLVQNTTSQNNKTELTQYHENPSFMFVNGNSNLAAYEGSWVQVYSSKGINCGEIEVLKDGMLMTAPIYGDDPLTANIDGPVNGDSLYFKINGIDLKGDMVFTADMIPRYLELEMEKLTNNTNISAPIAIKLSPNPFTTQVNISYEISERMPVQLTVTDVLGKVVSSLINEEQAPGTYNIVWEPESLPSGTCFLEISVDNQRVKIEKLIYLK